MFCAALTFIWADWAVKGGYGALPPACAGVEDMMFPMVFIFVIFKDQRMEFEI